MYSRCASIIPSLTITALLLAGCGMFSAADRAERNSPNFRAGYDDGCAAASTSGANPRAAPLRDDALYNSDKAYHNGWSNGFAACRNDAMGDPQIDNPVMSPVPH
ncbi:MAG TPA: hypothetical protein VHW69_07030 [Rhizomicrobium sp.]|jgi:hypothetical protein|nr:hypothetical protein [Rhizomicrobium sp.]